MTVLFSSMVFITTTPAWYIGAVIILALYMVISFLIWACADSEGESHGAIALVSIIVLILSSFFFVGSKEIATGRYRYEVLLEDSYSLTELTENYDIIDSRGKIWVIEEKVPSGAPLAID